MELKKFKTSDTDSLYGYFVEIGSSIPYFFPVTRERWAECLLADELDGEKIFDTTEIYLAVQDNKILGFIQFGTPNFCWTPNGTKVYHPSIGVIRQFYFNRERRDAGKALMNIAEEFLSRYNTSHAFFHILGMSCNAYHGKLPSSMSHVEAILTRHGFEKEHENVYYVLNIEDAQLAHTNRDDLVVERKYNSINYTEDFTALLHGKEVGWAQTRYLDRLTGGATTDTAYLTWIMSSKAHRGQGLGKWLLGYLIHDLAEKGFSFLHTDTADTNHIAQRFYESAGLEKRATTRSYLRKS